MNEIDDERSQSDWWKSQYTAVLLEPDPTKLTELVAFAEAAIYFRLQKLPQVPETQAERQAIGDAANALYTIKTEILKFPGLDPRAETRKSSGLE